jgi:SAM-dependent methyltransferase
LDVRTREAFSELPTEFAANIPVSELRERPFELPPAGSTVAIADTGPEAAEGAGLLSRMGRLPEVVPGRKVQPHDLKFRLWKATSLLDMAEHMRTGRALCLACGVGREAVILAAAGWHVLAVDLLPDALDRGRHLEEKYVPAGVRPIDWLVADLRQPLPDGLEQFALMTQFFYADSGTEARILRHLSPGGMALLESFSELHWHSLGRSKPESILRSHTWDRGFELSHDEDWHEGRHTTRQIVRKS